MVEQIDRDAAADWCESQPFPSKQAEAPMIRAGEYDHHSLVSAFVAHREAERATLQATVERQAAEIARLREALGTIARDGVGLQNVMDDHLGDVNAYNYHAMNYWASDSQWRKAKARQALENNNG